MLMTKDLLINAASVVAHFEHFNTPSVPILKRREECWIISSHEEHVPAYESFLDICKRYSRSSMTFCDQQFSTKGLE